jgi:methionyl-tRNA synthetase
VADVVNRIKDNGFVYEGTYEGWYCPRCADFKTESELIDGSKCPIHLIELEREKEDNWFFKLSAFQEPLERLYADRPEWVRPPERYNEALSFIKQGLNDVSLSRARIRWGVPVPWDPDQVIYVWIDALLNYYSALGYAREGEDLTERYWPATLHLIAKDILKFHAVIWPAMLMAAGLDVPHGLYIHGYLLQGEHKMSKSLGNVIDPFQVIELYGNDALRFYLLREVAFGQDGSVSPEGFEARYTSELANDYGNLASRTLAMVAKYRDGALAEAESDFDLGDLPGLVAERFDRADLSGALDLIWQRVKALNAYISTEEPWKLAKEESEAEHLDRVLFSLVDGLRRLTVELQPFMPDATATLISALDADRLGPIDPLFPRIEA